MKSFTHSRTHFETETEVTWKSPIATNDSALLYRVRQKEAEEEERSREYMEDRMQAILSLKGNIETNKVQ